MKYCLEVFKAHNFSSNEAILINRNDTFANDFFQNIIVVFQLSINKLEGVTEKTISTLLLLYSADMANQFYKLSRKKKSNVQINASIFCKTCPFLEDYKTVYF